jgi:hypothetical protein
MLVALVYTEPLRAGGPAEVQFNQRQANANFAHVTMPHNKAGQAVTLRQLLFAVQKQFPGATAHTDSNLDGGRTWIIPAPVGTTAPRGQGKTRRKVRERPRTRQ